MSFEFPNSYNQSLDEISRLLEEASKPGSSQQHYISIHKTGKIFLVDTKEQACSTKALRAFHKALSLTAQYQENVDVAQKIKTSIKNLTGVKFAATSIVHDSLIGPVSIPTGERDTDTRQRYKRLPKVLTPSIVHTPTKKGQPGQKSIVERLHDQEIGKGANNFLSKDWLLDQEAADKWRSLPDEHKFIFNHLCVTSQSKFLDKIEEPYFEQNNLQDFLALFPELKESLPASYINTFFSSSQAQVIRVSSKHTLESVINSTCDKKELENSFTLKIQRTAIVACLHDIFLDTKIQNRSLTFIKSYCKDIFSQSVVYKNFFTKEQIQLKESSLQKTFIQKFVLDRLDSYSFLAYFFPKEAEIRANTIKALFDESKDHFNILIDEILDSPFLIDHAANSILKTINP